MFNLHTDNPHLIKLICKYVYKNKELLQNFSNLKSIRYKGRLDYTTGIGYGNYTIKFNDKILFINYAKEGSPKAVEIHIEYYEYITITSDSDLVLDEFLKHVSDQKDTDPNTLNIYVTTQYGEWYKYNKIPKRNIDSIYIDDKIKNKLVNDIKTFISSEEEYNNFGIPYKRTYLLTGIPGSGKTSLIKALCHKFGYGLSIISVSKKFDNDGLLNAISNVDDKSFLLLEDVDSLFVKREATTDNPSLTFSSLINILDGVLYKHGSIIFMTTNHPEKLDSALIRIGRMDMILEFNYPLKNDIEKLFNDLIMKNATENTFEKFYNFIAGKKIPMSSIVNFLFTYKSNWLENINELLNTNSFIKNTLKENTTEQYYT
jgi:SpoVK/Ycf46/Vps4 family AAA+-type ATPase